MQLGLQTCSVTACPRQAAPQLEYYDLVISQSVSE